MDHRNIFKTKLGTKIKAIWFLAYLKSGENKSFEKLDFRNMAYLPVLDKWNKENCFQANVHVEDLEETVTLKFDISNHVTIAELKEKVSNFYFFR